MKKKVYVASSWRNVHQPDIVKELRVLGYEVYDFRHPNDKRAIGFQWSRIDPEWEKWTMEEYRKALMTDYAQFGFNRDFDAMKAADICVLVLPCGRSAHLEAGWMRGAGKKVIAFIWHEERIEPELMYGLLDGIAFDIQELAEMISQSNITMNLQPFDIEKVKAGAKVVTSEGREARYDGELDPCIDEMHRTHLFYVGDGSYYLYGDDGKFYAGTKVENHIERHDLFIIEE